ncbi:uncharacterized protein LOC129583774 [Paramacrobiotus metropolitanus]|uniref:uncharacterized protein LOC129583774 n=1 Tax=Paramacrobiotus metropolitanus TaxID=2943436 RepID=UPI00244589DD|nr:uncharacterized protein LOC129583774 [Paramacrobiotus metropolitanus]
MHFHRLVNLLDRLPLHLRHSIFTVPLLGSRNGYTLCTCKSFSTAIPSVAIAQPDKSPSSSTDDRPVQFSTSRAFLHKVFKVDKDNANTVNSRVVAVSLLVFMVYFFYLREENDLDRYMETPLWDRIPGLEKQTVMVLIEQLEKAGKDPSLAKARLAELQAEEAAGMAPHFRKPRLVSIHPPEYTPAKELEHRKAAQSGTS